MEDRLARIRRPAPRARKLRDWRRNRWNGSRWDRSYPGRPEREPAGRPWEGRGPIEAARQHPQEYASC